MAEEEENKNIVDLIDLTGHWFASFLALCNNGSEIRGGRILTIHGKFHPNKICELVVNNIKESLPQNIKDSLIDNGKPIALVGFNRIDPCKDCGFKGMELCEQRKLLDEVNKLKATIQEAKNRMVYYFGEFGGTFPNNPQMQNVYDVLCRDDEEKRK